MNTIHLLRAASLTALLAASLSAYAIPIHLYSVGEARIDYMVSGQVSVIQETVTEQSGGLAPLFYYEFVHRYPIATPPQVQSQQYEGRAGIFAIRFQEPVDRTVGNAISGNWFVSASECTGAWSGIIGSGTYVRSYAWGNSPSTAYTSLRLDGDVTLGRGAPVPEPATLATLGAGALALARRRKRA